MRSHFTTPVVELPHQGGVSDKCSRSCCNRPDPLRVLAKDVIGMRTNSQSSRTQSSSFVRSPEPCCSTEGWYTGLCRSAGTCALWPSCSAITSLRAYVCVFLSCLSRPGCAWRCQGLTGSPGALLDQQPASCDHPQRCESSSPPSTAITCPPLVPILTNSGWDEFAVGAASTPVAPTDGVMYCFARASSKGKRRDHRSCSDAGLVYP